MARRTPSGPPLRAVRFGLPAALLLAWAAPAPASAQVRIEITPPSFRFEVRPPLVVVTPGIEVVPDHDHEVFVVGGLWWARHDGHWYRAKRHDGRWVRVKHVHVPERLRVLPRGKYRHWKAHRDEDRRRGREVERRREARRHHEHGQEARKRDDRRHDRKHSHDGRRGRGRGHGGHKHKKGKGK